MTWRCVNHKSHHLQYYANEDSRVQNTNDLSKHMHGQSCSIWIHRTLSVFLGHDGQEGKHRMLQTVNTGLVLETHTHTSPRLLLFDGVKKTADWESAGLTVTLKIDVKEGAADRWMDGWRGIWKSWYQSTAANFMSFFSCSNNTESHFRELTYCKHYGRQLIPG